MVGVHQTRRYAHNAMTVGVGALRESHWYRSFLGKPAQPWRMGFEGNPAANPAVMITKRHKGKRGIDRGIYDGDIHP
jgi:hypothetical protein